MNNTSQVEAASCNLDISKTGKEKLRLGRKVKAWGPQDETLEFEPVCHVCLALCCYSDTQQSNQWCRTRKHYEFCNHWLRELKNVTRIKNLCTRNTTDKKLVKSLFSRS